MLGVLCVVALVTYPNYDFYPDINTTIHLAEPTEDMDIPEYAEYFEPVRSAALQRISDINTKQN